jgi:hypothetical protein
VSLDEELTGGELSSGFRTISIGMKKLDTSYENIKFTQLNTQLQSIAFNICYHEQKDSW